MASALSPADQALAKLLADDELYCARNLKIRTKDGKLEPFVWNDAQRLLHARLEEQKAQKGWVRAIVLKGRQQGCCLDPDTKVLTAGLEWVRIADLKPGQELVAVDEESSSKAPGTPGAGRGRRMRTSVVEAVVFTRQPSYRITLDDGRELITSGKHRWLVRKSQTQWAWRAIEDGRRSINVGDKLRSVTTPWGNPELEDYWFGGMIDGEGSFDYSERRTGVRLAVSQRAGAVFDRMMNYCAEREYGHYVISDDGPRKTKYGRQAVHAVNMSNLGTMFKVIGLCRPSRFIDKHWWDGKSMPDNGERVITKIEPLGERDVVDIQTSTGTFLAEGIVSHNSTYVAARFYKRTTTQVGKRTMILTHLDSATTNLFGMCKTYYDLSDTALKPVIKANSGNELSFAKLRSGYKVATAGSPAAGRSDTVQYLHGSEVAHWPNAQQIMAGLGQTVPLLPGSEVILESTANGLGNLFHQMWTLAVEGKSDFMPVFIPWFIQSEYRRPIPSDFQMTPEEAEYAESFDLDLEQVYWMRTKIDTDFAGDKDWFNQEYPATADMAFLKVGHQPLIQTLKVQRARKVKEAHQSRIGAHVVGVDPARFGDDSTVIFHRQGRVAWGKETMYQQDTMAVAGRCARMLQDDFTIRMMFIDIGGLGAGIYDRLVELGFSERITAVNFGERASDSRKYFNKRSEMWGEMAEWLHDPITPSIPDDDQLHGDLTAPSFTWSSNGQMKLDPKEKIKKDIGRSPDDGDALALTFAEPVAADDTFTEDWRKRLIAKRRRKTAMSA